MKNPTETGSFVVLEGMTSVSALLKADACNDRKIEKILIDREKRKSKAPEIGFLTAKSHEKGFAIEFCDAAEIDRITNGTTHGGIAACCTERTIPELTASLLIPDGFYAYPEGIEDPYNFGYTVRALYAAGADGIVIPPRNWMSAAGVVARSSAGTSELLPMFTADADTVVSVFHQAGYRIVCAGIRNSVSVYDADLKKPLLLVIGGEKRGISRNLLDSADQTVRIDYGREFRGSLPSASATAVLAFEIRRRNHP